MREGGWLNLCGGVNNTDDEDGDDDDDDPETWLSDVAGGGVDLAANLVAAGFRGAHYPPPKVWCFIRSYHADARWLSYALRSLHRFARHVVQRVAGRHMSTHCLHSYGHPVHSHTRAYGHPVHSSHDPNHG